MEAKKYSKLDTLYKYDEETVEELAEAMNEVLELKKRMSYLMDLISNHEDLHQYVWRTKDGLHVPHHKIEEDHFKNILTYLVQSGQSASGALKAEARRRSIELPSGLSERNVKRLVLHHNAKDIFDTDEYGF